MMASRQARVAFKGDSIMGVNVEGITDNIPAINNRPRRIPAAASLMKKCADTRAVAFIGNDIRTNVFSRRGSAGQNHRD